MKIIKPPLLKDGDTIGFLATSGELKDGPSLESAVNFFESRGFKVKLSDNINSKYRYLAGSDDERLNAIHVMFSDKSVNAIIALRGGYGAIRLINRLDYNLIRNNPKIFCGYSDITALNAMILKHSGLITFSGPMVLSDFAKENPDEYTVNKFFKTLKTGEFEYSGTFWGGNLSTLVSLCGQDFVPEFDFDLFVEDINEPVYKIDKMIRQLINIKEIRGENKSNIYGRFYGNRQKRLA